MKKLFALIIAASAALAPMQAFANWGSSETCSNDANGSVVNVNVQACDIDIL
jgi:hypothetical protein